MMGDQSLGERETVKRYREALSLARAQKDHEAMLRALIRLSMLLIKKESLKEAKQRCREAVVLAREMQSGVILAQCLCRLGFLFLHGGETEQALGAYQEACALFGAYNMKRDVVYVLHYVALAYEDLEDRVRSVEVDLQGEALARLIGDAQLQALHLGHLGLLYLSLDRYEEASPKLQQALDLYHVAGDSQGNQVVILLALAKQQLQKKEWLEALPLLEEAYFIAMLVQDERQQNYICWLLRRAAEQIGERDHKISVPASYDLYDLMEKGFDFEAVYASINKKCDHWFWEKGLEDEKSYLAWQHKKEVQEGHMRTLQGILAYEVGRKITGAYRKHQDGMKAARLAGDRRGEGANLLGVSRALAQPCMWELRGKIMAGWRRGYELLCGVALERGVFVSGRAAIPQICWSRGERLRAWEQSEGYYRALCEGGSQRQLQL